MSCNFLIGSFISLEEYFKNCTSIYEMGMDPLLKNQATPCQGDG